MSMLSWMAENRFPLDLLCKDFQSRNKKLTPEAYIATMHSHDKRGLHKAMTRVFTTEDDGGKMKPIVSGIKPKKVWLEISHESLAVRKRRVSGNINVFEGMLLWGKSSALKFPVKNRKYYPGSNVFNKIGPIHLDGPYVKTT